ncbi:hypothetical protein HD554DRAFT_1176264 [Boletus coccyginus]|nr:hypothetical protein HD554DRAFT_1176264 [Boletus coccyginus]
MCACRVRSRRPLSTRRRPRYEKRGKLKPRGNLNEGERCTNPLAQPSRPCLAFLLILVTPPITSASPHSLLGVVMFTRKRLVEFPPVLCKMPRGGITSPFLSLGLGEALNRLDWGADCFVNETTAPSPLRPLLRSMKASKGLTCTPFYPVF